MVRADKVETVDELTRAFRDSSAAVLTEYRGLTVAQLRELRRSLAGDATYAVVKNTLTRRAAKAAGMDVLESLLEGPSAIAFVTGDPVVVAKGIRDFARTYPSLVVKGGLVEQRLLSAAEIARLADLESREVLLARLAGAMTASLSQAAGLFSAPLSQLARVIAALEAEKKAETPAAQEAQPAAAEADEPVAAAAPETEEPAAEMSTEAAPEAAAEAEEPVAEPQTEAPEAAADSTDEPSAAGD
jgi:large subunit ribosomal protein L10